MHVLAWYAFLVDNMQEAESEGEPLEADTAMGENTFPPVPAAGGAQVHTHDNHEVMKKYDKVCF